MNTEKTITICGKEVRLRYCAAAETGYESLTPGKTASVFSPTPSKDEDGKEIILPPEATTADYIHLALAAVIAAYAKQNEDAPITAEEILYEATPDEVMTLITTVVQLRNEWYKVPEQAVNDKDVHDEEQPQESKNA
jgi:hypothetical protein